LYLTNSVRKETYVDPEYFIGIRVEKPSDKRFNLILTAVFGSERRDVLLCSGAWTEETEESVTDFVDSVRRALSQPRRDDMEPRLPYADP